MSTPAKPTDYSVLCKTKEEYHSVFVTLLSLGYAHVHGDTDPDSLAFMFGKPRNQPEYVSFETDRKEFSRSPHVGSGYEEIDFVRFLELFSPLGQPAPATQSLAEYGPAPQNPPNFYIDTHDVPTLRKIAQELAFEAGVAWHPSNKKIAPYSFRFLLVVRQADDDETRLWEKNHPYHGPPREGIPVYSAATQMGEIVRLLSAPAVPPVPPPPTPPEIHGYKAVYTAGASTVDFGCAKLGKNLLRDAAKLMGHVINSDGSVMRDAGVVLEQGCNRAVDSIVLSSGKTLSREKVRTILDYIAAVEEYAKKYPQKS